MDFMHNDSASQPIANSLRNGRRANWPFSLLLYYVIFLLFTVLASLKPLASDAGRLELLPSLFTAWCGATVGILLVWRFLRRQRKLSVMALIAGGAVGDIVCNFLAVRLGEGSAGHWFPRAALLATGNLGVLAAAIGAGVLVGRGLQKPGYLVMAAIVGALTDIFSVYAGPSKHVLSSAIFPYLSFQWGTWGLGIIPCVGAGDFIFLSLYFFGAKRFGLDERRTLVAMLVAFGLGFLSLLISPNGIPALPFMSALLLLTHGRELKGKMKVP
jgi:hypothetical protein